MPIYTAKLTKLELLYKLDYKIKTASAMLGISQPTVGKYYSQFRIQGIKKFTFEEIIKYIPTSNISEIST